MRRIVYISTASVLGEHEINAIVASADRNNPPARLTGFLLYNGRNFLQLLEGGEASLLSMYSSLARDRRHAGMSKLVDEPIADRSCPTWNMRWLRLSEDPLARRSELADELPPSLSPPARLLIESFALLN